MLRHTHPYICPSPPPPPHPDSAEVRYGLAKSLLETQDGVGEDITSVLPIDYARIDNSVLYLPAAVRDKIGPSAPGPTESASESTPSASESAAGDAVYRGYVAVFRVIKDLVRPSPSPSSSSEDSSEDAVGAERKDFPTVSVVTARLAELRASTPASASDRGDIAAFLDNGGKAEHALDCVVDRAREELTPLGREYDAEKRYIDAMFASEYAECANDRDFALVRAKLGLPVETLGVFPEEDEDVADPLSDDEE